MIYNDNLILSFGLTIIINWVLENECAIRKQNKVELSKRIFNKRILSKIIYLEFLDINFNDWNDKLGSKCLKVFFLLVISFNDIIVLFVSVFETARGEKMHRYVYLNSIKNS